MPTKNPRLSVVVTEDQHAILTRLSALQDRSAASFVREIIDTATPLLRVLLATVEAQHETLAAVPEQFAKAVAQTLSGMLADDPDQLDLVAHIASLVGSDEEREGGIGCPHRSASEERTADAARSDPPSSNTGVRYADQGGSSPNQGRIQGVTHG